MPYFSYQRSQFTWEKTLFTLWLVKCVVKNNLIQYVWIIKKYSEKTSWEMSELYNCGNMFTHYTLRTGPYLYQTLLRHHPWQFLIKNQHAKSASAANVFMKTLLLLTTVFKVDSPLTLLPASVNATVEVPSLAVPLATAVISFT